MVSQLIFASKLSELEVKIYCNTTKPNVPKWRQISIGLKFNLVHFNCPQSHILLLDHFEGPCIWDIQYASYFQTRGVVMKLV